MMLRGKEFNEQNKNILKSCIKLLNETAVHHGYQYKEGLNVLPEGEVFNCDRPRSKGGFYFTLRKYVFDWIKSTPSGEMKYLCLVTIPDDAQVYIEDKKSIKTDRFILGPKRTIQDYLSEHPVTVDKNLVSLTRNSNGMIHYLSCLPSEELNFTAQIRLIKHGKKQEADFDFISCWQGYSEEILFMMVEKDPRAIFGFSEHVIPSKYLLMLAIRGTPSILSELLERPNWMTYELCLVALQCNPLSILEPMMFSRFFLDTGRLGDFEFFCQTSLPDKCETQFVNVWQKLSKEEKSKYTEPYLQHLVRAIPNFVNVLRITEQDTEALYITAGKRKTMLIESFLNKATEEKQKSYLKMISIHVIDHIKNPTLDLIWETLSLKPTKCIPRLPSVLDKTQLFNLISEYPQLLTSLYELQFSLFTNEQLFLCVQHFKKQVVEIANNNVKNFLSRLLQHLNNNQDMQDQVIYMFPPILFSCDTFPVIRRQTLLLHLLNTTDEIERLKLHKRWKSSIETLLASNLPITLLDVSDHVLQFLADYCLGVFQSDQTIMFHLLNRFPRSVLSLSVPNTTQLLFSLQRDPSIINNIKQMSQLRPCMLECVTKKGFTPCAQVVEYITQNGEDSSDGEESDEESDDDY